MRVVRVGEHGTRLLLHEVRAVHDTTGAPVAVTARFTGETPRGWALRAPAPNLVVVTRDAASPVPPAPVKLHLEVRDPAFGARLAQPAADVDLDRPVVTHRFAPKPSALEVRVLEPNGDPRTGVAVVVRPVGGGADLALAEDPADHGLYRSPARVWGPEFHPIEIRVAGDLLTKVALDVTRPVTSLRLVDTT